jgi:small-conductance mechanosensitive channel
MIDALTLGLAAGLGTLGTCVLLVVWLQRRSTTARQIGAPLYVAALAAALGVFGALSGGRFEKVASNALVFAAVLMALAVLHVLAIYLFDGVVRGRIGVRLPPLIPRVLTMLVYVVGLLVTLRVRFPELSLGPLLATSAVTSLVLGLALQPILGNFFAGLVIGFERPFRLNDWVEVSGRQARVVDITWRATHLRTRDNDNLIIPNSKIAEQELTNFYYPHTLHLDRIQVGVHYSTPPYRVTGALLEAARQVSLVLDRPSAEVFLLEFGDSAIVYELRIWLDDIADQPRISNEVRRRIWEVFRRDGIVIPYPIRTLEIEPSANRIETSSSSGEGPPVLSGWLFVEDGPGRGLSIALQEVTTVGRSSDCDLALPDPNISKQHLRIEREGDRYVLSDLDQRRATRVGGQPIDRHVLSPFERIEIGESRLVFELIAERKTPASGLKEIQDE